MRKLYTYTVLLLVSIQVVNAQNKDVLSSSNYFTISDSIENNKQILIEKSLRNQKDYYRWDWFWKDRVDNTGEMLAFITELIKFNISQEANNRVSSSLKSISSENLWNSLGPFTAAINQNKSNGRGRFESIWVNPVNNDHLLAGSNNAGIWRSNDGGVNWERISKNYVFGGVMSIAVHPSDPNIIYIASRLGSGGGGSILRALCPYYNLGIWKTENGLASNIDDIIWSQLGGQDIPYVGSIYKILIDPIAPTTLYALHETDVYKSINSGLNWVSTNVGISGGYLQEMVMKPNNPSTLYISGSNNLFKSSNGGLSWISLPRYNGFNTAKIAIAVDVNYPDNLYAYYCNLENDRYEYLELSTNGGSSFVHEFSNYRDSHQGAEDFITKIWVSPNSEVFIGGVTLFSSSSSYLVSLSGNQVHPDVRDCCFPNSNSGEMFIATDGGIFVDYNNSGTNWTRINGNLIGHEFYSIGVSQEYPDKLIGGTHDNGSYAFDAGSWTWLNGGDGGTSIYADDPSGLSDDYFITANRRVYKNSSSLGVFLDNYDGTFVKDPNDVDILYRSEYNDITELHDIYRSTNSGDDWTPIVSLTNKLIDLSICDSNSDIAYFTTYNSWTISKLFATNDNWNSIYELSYSGLESIILTEPITSIHVNPMDENELFVSFGGFTFNEKVYYSKNGGTSWINISGSGLPNFPVHCMFYDYVNGDLYIGTDVGLYCRNASTSIWHLADGFPRIIVTDIELSKYTGNLYAATYGLGVFSYNLGGGFCKANGSVISIDSNQGWSVENDICSDIEIIYGGNLEISSAITMSFESEICVRSGGVLHINGGLIINGSITVENGGTLILDSGGEIYCSEGDVVDVSIGGILLINEGEIQIIENF